MASAESVAAETVACTIDAVTAMVAPLRYASPGAGPLAAGRRALDTTIIRRGSGRGLQIESHRWARRRIITAGLRE